MIRRGHHHGIQILPRKEITEVGIILATLVRSFVFPSGVMMVRGPGRGFTPGGEGIAHGQGLSSRKF
jgi:hypothetical protein